MKWGLTQGMIGGGQKSLAPVLTAAGPNTYLDQRDFFKMLGAAFGVHVVAVIIISLLPHEEVVHIPVRALSFKLGDQDRIAAYAPAAAPAAAQTEQVAAPVMQASPALQSTERVTAKPTPPKPQPKAEAAPKPKPVSAPVQQKPAPSLPPSTPPAIAATPQQYVREVGQAPTQPLQPVQSRLGTPEGAIGGQGMENIQTEQTSRELRDRYEQQISGWIKRHQYYPADAGGRTGRVVVRMRIDRSGVVRYYAIEETSGIRAMDLAALDMIRRANPLPAAPVNYPAGSLIEFLIPINFRP